MSKLRIVIFPSASPTSLDHFLRRLRRDLREVEVSGVLYDEARRSKLSRTKRINRALRLASDSDFRAFVGHRFRQRVKTSLEESLGSVLHLVHAALKNPNGTPLTLGQPRNMSLPAIDMPEKGYDFVFSAHNGENYDLLPGSLYRCGHPESLWELELLMQGLLEFRKVSASSKTEQSQLIGEARPFAGGGSP